MSIAVRQADLESDRQAIIDIIARYLNPRSGQSRFDWLYKNNPQGGSRAWVAVDTDSGAMVGMLGAFLRHVYVAGREEPAWVLGDFCIDDQYRSLGPALMLQRACLAEVDLGQVAFCYDFPSASMMAVYKRLGIDALGQIVRLAKPLRVDRKVRKIVKSPAVVRGVSAAANFLLALNDGISARGDRLTSCFHQGSCGEEFSVLAREVGRGFGFCIQRSAEYLNWRYLANPLYRYEFIISRRNEALLAYAVFTHNEEDALLVDLFGVEDAEVIRTLIHGLSAILRERGVVTVSVSLLETHPWLPLLQGLGFKAREKSPLVVYPSPIFLSSYGRVNTSDWFLTHGDRDS
jgi:hypothetical protein